MQEVEPMEITPIDDSTKNVPEAAVDQTMVASSDEDEARQAIDMLRGDDISGRVAAANKLETVAAALGEQRTREELVPFLTDGVDDEDEVLMAIASSLGKLVNHVGGPDHASSLLPPLELLLTVEENTVREAASESAQKVADVLPQEAFQGAYAEMIARLATKEWFTARISAAGLIAFSYERLTVEQRKESITNFAALCVDDTPMVRRVASQFLGEMFRTVVRVDGRETLAEDGVLTTELVPLYEKLASNEQPDSVRLQTTENCALFGEVLTALANENPLTESEVSLVKILVPLIVATIDDRSWRVRWTAASKFAGVIAAFSALPDAIDSLVPAYEKLLQDPEAEVRTAATFNLAEVASCEAMVQASSAASGEESAEGARISVAERLVKRITSLTEDDSEHVRAALAMVATQLAPILGRDATISHLVPPVLLLLRDAASEVRLNLISSLSALNEVIGVDLLSQSLLPAILDLAQDGKWRIRLAIIEHVPMLAQQLGRDFFSEKLSSLCVGWLGDDISSIRSAAAQSLKELTALFGSEWAVEYLLPAISDIRFHKSYLRRLTAVQACTLMSTVMDPETALLELLPLVLEMATDTVPNIRFNVAKGLEKMGPVCGRSAYESQIRPVLSILIEDEDRDVQFFALTASKSLDAKFDTANK
mmetsp:Transcript_15037/g.21282  ORF Transcript_15037/g.21282 Transcript_15037/m.21282 type:complete len:656 (+) Transcript_15037:190-2157(+)